MALPYRAYKDGSAVVQRLPIGQSIQSLSTGPRIGRAVWQMAPSLASLFSTFGVDDVGAVTYVGRVESLDIGSRAAAFKKKSTRISGGEFEEFVGPAPHA